MTDSYVPVGEHAPILSIETSVPEVTLSPEPVETLDAAEASASDVIAATAAISAPLSTETETVTTTQANPFADVALGPESGGGLRVHAALASGCNPNTHLSIRVHLNRHFGLDQLADFGMVSTEQLGALRGILSRRESFLISGATGSGKTTLLRAMLAECIGERIIALEDVSELGLQSPNFVSLQTRQSNIEGRGEITLERLVRESLRMRPDRLVVGEVRGAELMVMLQALNTGHRGAGATIHANSLADVMPRVNAIARNAGVDSQSIAEQMQSAFSWIIHVDSKKVVQIARHG